MGLGQTLLTIMALVLMGRLILSINSITLDTGFSKDLAEYAISATSLGTSMLEKIEGLSFDEKTIAGDIELASNMTSASLLKSEYPEISSDEKTFDDVDDYNGFAGYDTVGGAIFKSVVLVEYVKVNTVAQKVEKSTIPTLNKRIIAYVTSEYLLNYRTDPPKQDTLKFEKILGYWFFR